MKRVAANVLLSASLASAAIVGLEPSPGAKYRTGGQCDIKWTPDTTGTWKSMKIELMTGPNANAVSIGTVATGIDGTAQPGSYAYTCPEVSPNAAIYFYRFTQDGDPNSLFTTRFTITAPDGSSTPEPHPTQPDGAAIPWGTGSVLSGLSASPTSPSGTNSTTSSKLSNGCSKSSQCPEDSPCCSEYGVCGRGQHCLAGCDPFGSFKPAACMPVPAFVEPKNYTFTDTDHILNTAAEWTGAVDQYDWVMEANGTAKASDLIKDNHLAFSLTKEGQGIRIASTRSLLYGNVTVRLRAAIAETIATSIILLSGARDEIDFGFTGNSSHNATTAYYFRGESNIFAVAQTHNVTNKTETHEYTISWTETSLAWLVDGVPFRNLSASFTIKDGQPHFPNTPSRISIGMWPVSSANSTEANVTWNASLADSSSESPQGGVEMFSFVESVHVVPAAKNGAADPAQHAPTAQISSSSASAVSFSLPTAWWTAPLAMPTATAATLQTQVATATQGLYEQATSNAAHAAGQVGDFFGDGIDAVASQAGAAWTMLDRTTNIKRDWQWFGLGNSDQPSTSAAYTYGLDSNGRLTVAQTDARTTLLDENDTGLKVAQAPVSSAMTMTATGSTTLPTQSAMATTSSSSASPSSTSIMNESNSFVQAWNKLPTIAHVGIIVGCVLVALLIVVCCGYMFRRASSGALGRKNGTAAYSRIGTGNLEPSTPYYNPALQGYDDPASGQAALSRKSTMSADAQFPGGFVSSKKSTASRKSSDSTRRSSMPAPVMSQYAADYVPYSQRGGSAAAPPSFV